MGEGVIRWVKNEMPDTRQLIYSPVSQSQSLSYIHESYGRIRYVTSRKTDLYGDSSAWGGGLLMCMFWGVYDLDSSGEPGGRGSPGDGRVGWKVGGAG